MASFEHLVCAKTVGFSHSDFSFVVEPLCDAAGDEPLRPEVKLRMSSRCWRRERAIFFMGSG
jgi:hypothetical protein